MLRKGFMFGMLLQIAIGPISIYIFKTAVTGSFLKAESGVAGATLVDAAYIICAILGLAALIKSDRVVRVLKLFGFIVLTAYGLSTILGVFGINLMPSVQVHTINGANVFLNTVILTVANPLTIIFWAGVFSAKVVEDGLKKKDLYIFGLGAVLSTLIFMTLVAIIGRLAGIFLPDSVISILNVIVGLFLIYFAVKMVLKDKIAKK